MQSSRENAEQRTGIDHRCLRMDEWRRLVMYIGCIFVDKIWIFFIAYPVSSESTRFTFHHRHESSSNTRRSFFTIDNS